MLSTWGHAIRSCHNMNYLHPNPVRPLLLAATTESIEPPSPVPNVVPGTQKRMTRCQPQAMVKYIGKPKRATLVGMYATQTDAHYDESATSHFSFKSNMYINLCVSSKKEHFGTYMYPWSRIWLTSLSPHRSPYTFYIEVHRKGAVYLGKRGLSHLLVHSTPLYTWAFNWTSFKLLLGLERLYGALMYRKWNDIQTFFRISV